MALLAIQHVAPLARATRETSAVPDTVRHVLSTDCLCSTAVAERLIARTALADRNETVWLEGQDSALEGRLRAAGYRVTAVTSAEVRRELGAAGTPFLFVYGSDGRERYAGGYAPYRLRVAADVQDLAIIDDVAVGRARPPYPAYGCLGGNAQVPFLWED